MSGPTLVSGHAGTVIQPAARVDVLAADVAFFVTARCRCSIDAPVLSLRLGKITTCPVCRTRYAIAAAKFAHPAAEHEENLAVAISSVDDKIIGT